MVRHAIIKQRINKEAWELKEFTANQLMDKLNNYPNMHGRNKTSRQVTIQRLTNLLYMNPNIKFIPNFPNCKKAGIYKWIGDEE